MSQSRYLRHAGAYRAREGCGLPCMIDRSHLIICSVDALLKNVYQLSTSRGTLLATVQQPVECQAGGRSLRSTRNLQRLIHTGHTASVLIDLSATGRWPVTKVASYR
jgi:hypothetical protein